MTQEKSRKYPDSPRMELVESLHGVEVADPYRWLEEIDSEQIRRWITAQNEVSFAYLGRIPARERLQQRISELWDYEKYGLPFKRGGRYFFSRNAGLQNQAVLYWLENLQDEPKLLLDPNLLSEDGTVAVTNYAASRDGRWLAYGLSSAGSDWQEWPIPLITTSSRELPTRPP